LAVASFTHGQLLASASDDETVSLSPQDLLVLV